MRKLVVLAFALLVPTLGAQAQEALQPQTQNGITFTSGGIGSEGRDALRQVQGSYNLKLMFAVQGSGDYLSDVKVKVMDGHGATLLDTISEGPYFLAQLKPGTYKIVADSAGRPQTRTVSVDKGTAAASFYWPTGG
jgi:hypothetical protein